MASTRVGSTDRSLRGIIGCPPGERGCADNLCNCPTYGAFVILALMQEHPSPFMHILDKLGVLNLSFSEVRPWSCLVKVTERIRTVCLMRCDGRGSMGTLKDRKITSTSSTEVESESGAFNGCDMCEEQVIVDTLSHQCNHEHNL
jgi:hypothetical protein